MAPILTKRRTDSSPEPYGAIGILLDPDSEHTEIDLALRASRRGRELGARRMLPDPTPVLYTAFTLPGRFGTGNVTRDGGTLGSEPISSICRPWISSFSSRRDLARGPRPLRFEPRVLADPIDTQVAPPAVPDAVVALS